MNKKLRAKLVDSIRKHSLPPFTEVTAGKLLTDVRKLQEEMGETQKYPTLKLYCDWVVHSRLSGPKVEKFLAEMDERYDDLLLHNILITVGMSPYLADFLSFQGFKNELNAFLKHCYVGTPHVLNKNAWEDFERAYCNLVGDCLLTYENKQKPLKHIDSALVSIIKPQFNATQLRYDPATVPTGTEWTFFKNGTKLFSVLLTWGTKPALPDALRKPNVPQTPSRPPG